ncbi:MAG: hypothetical protein JEZ09_05470 [Salinivirgaceae bacterium]|nr:hypothetical protein [Salinivirgaceae bacterium]
MIKKLLLFTFIAILLVGCASKRYAKKGFEFEQAGLYENAADMYYMSVMKNPKNVEAQIGLKKNGQLALDHNLGKFLNLYNADNSKDAVYKYIDCENFYNKMLTAGTELNIPSHYKEYYEEVKIIYLQNKYNEAYLLLEEEKFNDAEVIFNEILAIEPGYQDVKELKNTAHFEPIYRKGKELMNIEQYRKSYYKFQEIFKKTPNYKDAKELSNKVLEMATITIAIIDFKNSSATKNVQLELKSGIQKSLTETKSPFIKLIDRENTQNILSEQILTLEGNVDESLSAKAGKMFGAKALLAAEVTSYKISHGKLKSTLKKGYIKEKIVEKKGEEEIVKYVYHKTTYNEYSMTRYVTCNFNYKLISAETGEILVADAISRRVSDDIHYASFDGNKDKLIPGYWENKKVDGSKDVKNDNASDIRKLKHLLASKTKIKSIEQLKKEINTEVAKLVTEKIERYDPEN